MKIIVTGATGLIGKRISQRLIEDGHDLIIFTRSIANAKKLIPHAKDYVLWDYNLSDWHHHLEDAHAVFHLAGENVMAKRWTESHKTNVLSSRVASTRALVGAIQSVRKKPRVFISASAVGYYGNSNNEVDENSPRGTGFLAEVTEAWERASIDLEKMGVRRVNIRIGIVLDKSEGALARMITPFKFFIGGPIGSGNQWFPWIHIDDIVGIFLHSVNNDFIKGAVNAVAPEIVTMNLFAKTLGDVMNRPSLVRVPSFILQIVLGEGAEAILGGAKVSSNKITNYNYKFRHPSLRSALEVILK